MLEEKNNNYDYMDERLPDDGGRSLEDIISAVGEQDLAEIPHIPMTPERLAALAAARDAEENLAASEAKHDAAENLATPTVPVETAKTRKKKRLYKLVGGIAAVFVLILVGAVIAFNALSVDVGADKNQKEEIVTEDGVVIEDGGYGASSEDSIVLTEWEDVLAEKDINAQLIVPEYIPEGYEFDKLTIGMLDFGDVINEYIFICDKDAMLEIEIFSPQKGEMYLEIDDSFRTIPSKTGEIYIQDGEMKIATTQIDDGRTVTVWCSVSDREILKVIEGLSN